MSNGSIDNLIKYRLDRAENALEEARLLFESDHINTYVNRLYYAARIQLISATESPK